MVRRSTGGVYPSINCPGWLAYSTESFPATDVCSADSLPSHAGGKLTAQQPKDRRWVPDTILPICVFSGALLRIRSRKDRHPNFALFVDCLNMPMARVIF